MLPIQVYMILHFAVLTYKSLVRYICTCLCCNLHGDKYFGSPVTTIGPTAGIGLGQIQIELDFDTWILLDLDIIGYGYSFALNLIGLDYVGQTIRG